MESVTFAQWRALVDKELAGKPFDKVLVHKALEGVSVEPLYASRPGEHRDLRGSPFRICMRHEDGTDDVKEGADALWLSLRDVPAVANAFFVVDADARDNLDALKGMHFALNVDPLARRKSTDLAFIGQLARTVEERFPEGSALMVSTLPYHEAGADPADELAIALATGARYLESLLASGFTAERAARQMAVQIAVGRDTFVELCKLRALRTCWSKLIAAAGAREVPRTRVHAVCSSRTLTVRDPWVNMLRVTTQVFSAVLGGADLVTPAAFDQGFGAPSARGRRIARNTGLVLREESFLGKVVDAAGGSYYFESLTDALAREAWKRFRAIEQEGGMVAALESGRLDAKLDASWRESLARIRTRKMPVLGVSEFANLEEALPRAVPTTHGRTDGAPFEELRARADARPREAVLVTLGTFAESRPRTGFAAGFFAAGGIRSRETADDTQASIACLCGTDESYATEAATRARALKAKGCTRVLLAGKPGALEASLREAGVDGFIYVGCDVVAVLSELLEIPS